MSRIERLLSMPVQQSIEEADWAPQLESLQQRRTIAGLLLMAERDRPDNWMTQVENFVAATLGTAATLDQFRGEFSIDVSLTHRINLAVTIMPSWRRWGGKLLLCTKLESMAERGLALFETKSTQRDVAKVIRAQADMEGMGIIGCSALERFKCINDEIGDKAQTDELMLDAGRQVVAHLWGMTRIVRNRADSMSIELTDLGWQIEKMRELANRNLALEGPVDEDEEEANAILRETAEAGDPAQIATTAPAAKTPQTPATKTPQGAPQGQQTVAKPPAKTGQGQTMTQGAQTATTQTQSGKTDAEKPQREETAQTGKQTTPQTNQPQQQQQKQQQGKGQQKGKKGSQQEEKPAHVSQR